MEKTFFIGICTLGGIISEVFIGGDQKEVTNKIYGFYENSGFDSQSDDARIFTEKGEEVFSYEEMATCSNCGKTCPESEINLTDYEIDVCTKCEKLLYKKAQ